MLACFSQAHCEWLPQCYFKCPNVLPTLKYWLAIWFSLVIELLFWFYLFDFVKKTKHQKNKRCLHYSSTLQILDPKSKAQDCEFQSSINLLMVLISGLKSIDVYIGMGVFVCVCFCVPAFLIACRQTHCDIWLQLNISSIR